jgi:hypothetical protein
MGIMALWCSTAKYGNTVSYSRRRCVCILAVFGTYSRCVKTQSSFTSICSVTA